MDYEQEGAEAENIPVVWVCRARLSLLDTKHFPDSWRVVSHVDQYSQNRLQARPGRVPCHQVDQPLVGDGPVAVLVLLSPGARGFDDKQQRYPQIFLLSEAADEPVENLPVAVTGQVVAGVDERVDDGEVGLQQLFRV